MEQIRLCSEQEIHAVQADVFVRCGQDQRTPGALSLHRRCLPRRRVRNGALDELYGLLPPVFPARLSEWRDVGVVLVVLLGVATVEFVVVAVIVVVFVKEGA